MLKANENRLTKNVIINICSVSPKNNDPGYNLNSVTAPIISRIKPTVFRTGSGIIPTI